MIATAHQPAFMPWLGLLHKIASSDVFISWDDVQAEDSGFENRQEVYTATGRQWLTVPIRKNRELKIRELAVVNQQPWARKHWRTIELAYSGAPFWHVHSQFLRWVYDQEWLSLVDLNGAILDYLVVQFKIRGPRFLKLSDLKLPKPAPPAVPIPLSADQHPVAVPAHVSIANQTIIAACRSVGANKYIFGGLGNGYADRLAFLAAGIEPMVQSYEPVPYRQMQHGVFEPRLWAFDLLLNVERDRAIEVMVAGGRVDRMK